ncbi:MAG: TIGR03032 family protein [Cyanobacteria bacterium J06598_1]
MIAAQKSTPALQVVSSEGLAEWLQLQQLSLAFTTYQTNRLFCVGTTLAGRLALHERLFDKPMGLFAEGDRLYMSSRYQVWQFDNLLEKGEMHQECDRLYAPKTAHTTGDLNVHDVVKTAAGELLFVNTDFSCLARISDRYSFEPVWQPPFITKLVAEDRCHLNGLALRDGEPAFMTACSSTDQAAGWRNHRCDGGVVLNVQSNEIVASGLSMPHSPRWYQGKLWLLNAGSGDFGYVDFEKGQFVPVAFCPGFVRGLTFWKNFAFVGLSKLRSRPFIGLTLEERLAEKGEAAKCGLSVIDLNTGAVVHQLTLEGVVEELFDVVVLPGVRQPQALGFQSDEIERLVTFPGAAGLVMTKPTVKRPGVGAAAPIAGIPMEAVLEKQTANTMPQKTPNLASLKFQQVHHLTASNLVEYDHFTFPSLQQRWLKQPQQGELFGISAVVEGNMVGFAIAEKSPDRSAEILSLFVAPEYRQLGIGTRLVAYLEKESQKADCTQMSVTYLPTELTAVGLEPLLNKLNWPAPIFSVEGTGKAYKVFVKPQLSVAK